MAVIVSPSQNEIALMAKQGLTIEPHRRRMVNEVLPAIYQGELWQDEVERTYVFVYDRFGAAPASG